MNDLSALNRMLTVKFELRIDWYTNKGQMSSTASNVMMCHFDPWPSRTVSVVFMKLFLITSQQPNGTILCYKTFFIYRPIAQQDRAGDLLSCTPKA